MALQLSGVSKAFGPTQALDDVSFNLAKGSIHSLLGGNGSGKSTLIKILAGVESADAGRLECPKGPFDLRTMTPAQAWEIGLRFVHQQASTFAELSVAENLAFGRGFDTATSGRIRWRATREHASAVLERFGIDAHPETELGDLSPAMQTMVAIARALQDRDEKTSDGVLVLDEPTAALPDSEVSILLDALRRYAGAGQTILYVTHRLEEVFSTADQATLLRDGRLVETVSPRELTHDDLVELITGQPVKQVEMLRGRARGSKVLEVKELSAGPLKPTNLCVRAGEIVGVSGLIGSGRSSLLKALFGVLPSSGQVAVDGRAVSVASPHESMSAGFALVPEDRSTDACFSELSVKENMSITALDRYWSAGRLHSGREDFDARALVDEFLVKTESVDAPLSSLSGGNQQKVILARWLRREPRVLLLDEPTQGVDVGARTEIYALIHAAVTAGAVALLASSDFEELTTICDRVIVLRKGSLIGELDGDDLDSEQLQRLAHQEIGVAA